MRDAELNELVFDVLISRMRREGHLGTLYEGLQLNLSDQEKNNYFYQLVKKLIKSAKEIFQHESTLINIETDNQSMIKESESRSVVVVGDLHGNIDDLIKIFNQFGFPPYENRSYLFLGDYVDRGNNSLEVIILLFALKIKYPDRIYLIRGNHESKFISSQYGFKKECLLYFDTMIYRKFCHAFSYMPIAATINKSIFCVHGGISPFALNIEQIEQIQKPIRDIRNTKIVSELLWSDPSPSSSFSYRPSNRGIGYFYSESDISNFLENNNLDLIIRAHKFCPNGFSWCGDKCLTVFSSSDYCGEENSAAIVIIDKIRKNNTENNCYLNANMLSYKFNVNWKIFGDLSVELVRFSTGPFISPQKKRIIIPDWVFIEQTPNIFLQPQQSFLIQDSFYNELFSNVLDDKEKNANGKSNEFDIPFMLDF